MRKTTTQKPEPAPLKDRHILFPPSMHDAIEAEATRESRTFTAQALLYIRYGMDWAAEAQKKVAHAAR